jgi:hypothetical protein
MTAAAIHRVGAAGVLRWEALGELCREVCGEAKGGTTPETVFRAKPAARKLGWERQARLRAELHRMGLRVEDFTRHAPEDTHPSQKVVREGDMTSQRVATARALLSPYVDPAGCVSEQVLWGVARLAGLHARAAASLSQFVRVRRHLAVAAEAPAPPIAHAT